MLNLSVTCDVTVHLSTSLHQICDAEYSVGNHADITATVFA